MTFAIRLSAMLQLLPKRFLVAFLSITQRRQRRRLMIWDPQTLAPIDPTMAKEKATLG